MSEEGPPFRWVYYPWVPRGPTPYQWRQLVAAALAGKPKRLLKFVSFPHLRTGGRSFVFVAGAPVSLRMAPERTGPELNEEMRPNEVRPLALPDFVATTIADLRRRRRGRPAKADTTYKAATEWQREEARYLYGWARLAYKRAKAADRSGTAMEYRGSGDHAIDIGVPSREPVVVRGHGPLKEYALELVAELTGSTPEAVRKLIYRRRRR